MKTTLKNQNPALRNGFIAIIMAASYVASNYQNLNAQPFIEGISVTESTDLSPAPHPSAMLDVRGVTKGVLIPRMAASQRDAITPLADGLLVFVTTPADQYGYWFYDDNINQWRQLGREDLWTLHTNGTDIFRATGGVTIGTGTPLYFSKLTVFGGTDRAGYFKSEAGITLRGFNGGGSPSNINIGVEGIVQQNGATTEIGVSGVANGQNSNNVGVRGWATGGTDATGVNGIATSYGGTNYGVYGSASSGTVNYAGYFSGDVVITGGFSVGPSDSILKENIQDLSGCSNIIAQLKPKSFNYKYNNPQYKVMNLTKDPECLGLIAQEVEPIFPSIVKTEWVQAQLDSSGIQIFPKFSYKSVNYIKLIPILIKAVQEQQVIINQQQSTITQMQTTIDNLEQRVTALENK